MFPSVRPSSSASSRSTSASKAIPTTTTTKRPSSSRSNLSNLQEVNASPPPAAARKRNLEDASSQPPKRRKEDGQFLPMEELLKPSVTIKPHPPNVLVPPRALFPVMLLPRETLPLACLDLSAPYGEFAAGRHYESRIRILELEGRLGSNILIARSEGSGAVYAIEREPSGLYVLCKLGAWVDLGELSRQATAACEKRLPKEKPATTGRLNVFNPPLLTAQGYHEQKKRNAAFQELRAGLKNRPISRSGSMTETPKQDSSVVQLPTPIEDGPSKSVVQLQPPHPSSTATLTSTPTRPPGDPAQEDSLREHPTAAEIFQNLLSQYSEALYHSMGSLAYFAKGPLSRARAAFHLDHNSTLDMGDLIVYLRSLVMTPQLLSKKYSEAVPPIVDQMKSLIDMTEYPDSTQKKRKRKMKLGRDGMYPEEADHVRRWWKVHKPEIRDDQTCVSPDEIRYHISSLRARETQLQLILVLEVLALEAMQPVGGVPESQLPGQEPEPAPEPPKKPKKKQDFSVLVDLLADRLCIWQTTTSDNIKSLVESQMRDSDPAKTVRSNAGQLKEFCVDIIIPFFSARLPKKCDTISRKFGGPVAASPPKPKAPKEPKSQPKPGSVVKRTATRPKTTKSLEQIMNKEKEDRLRRSVSRGPADAIAQLRRATAAPIPGLKRENSEPKRLSDIPRRESSASLKERPVNVFSRSSSGIGSVDEAKAKKKAMVEAQLQDAISALKKPNRELAGRVAVEETEQRLFRGPTHIKKPRKPVRQPVDKVQVKATPVLTARYRDALAAESQRALMAPSHLSYEPEIIPSSGLCRDKRKPGSRIEETPMRKNIAATPLRRAPLSAIENLAADDVVPTSSPLLPHSKPVPSLFSKMAGSGRRTAPALSAVPEDVVPTSSPIQMRRAAPVAAARPSTLFPPVTSNPFATPVKSKMRHLDEFGDGLGAIEDSPMMMRASAPAPPVTASPIVEDTRSIYQRLGWDDDDDLL